MTLDEAIRFTKQALENLNPDERVYTEFRLTVEEVTQLLVFLQELKRFRETFGDVKNTKFCIPECKEGCEKLVEQYERKNAELKRMLRLAVKDIGKMKSCEEFPFCVGCPKENEPYCEWKHHDEAMELLGGTKNAEN